MLEIIKEAGNILKDLPDLAIWILVGILFYKVVIIGSVFGFGKLVVNTVKDMYMKPKDPVLQKIEFEFDGEVYTHDGALTELKAILRKIKAYRGAKLGINEIRFINEAIDEKLEKENILTGTDLYSYCKKFDGVITRASKQ